jgi:NADH oxidase (H2O2-forming)
MLSTRLRELRGNDGKLVAAVTDGGEVPCQMAFMAADEKPNTALAESIGVRLGSAHGVVVDDRMRTNVPNVYAAGALVETMQAVAGIPVSLLPSTYAYPQGRIAGTNAAGGEMRTRAAYFPWAMEVGKIQIGGVLVTETLAKALGRPYVLGQAKGITSARYHPKVEPMNVKLLVDPKTREVIGVEFFGGDGVKERSDFMAFAMRKHATVDELANMENVYSPPIGALNEPIAVAAKDALKRLSARRARAPTTPRAHLENDDAGGHSQPDEVQSEHRSQDAQVKQPVQLEHAMLAPSFTAFPFTTVKP